MRAVGVDGCKGGWVLAVVEGDDAPGEPLSLTHLLSVPTFASVMNLAEEHQAAALAVDMPVGLLDMPVKGGRACDRAARKVLGRRHACVFSAPARPVLGIDSGLKYAEALGETRRLTDCGISAQTWATVSKVREVDEYLRSSPHHRGRVFEVHPRGNFRCDEHPPR